MIEIKNVSFRHENADEGSVHDISLTIPEGQCVLLCGETGSGKTIVIAELDLDGFAERHPMSLSGGQKQRTAIASAMLADKEILLFDEPTSGLDFRHMEQTAELLSSLKNKKTVFVVTHDLELVSRCCTHILKLDNGRATML